MFADKLENKNKKIEKELITIWMDVLGNASIKVTDNIFVLGANSLQIVQMLDRVSNEFPVDINAEGGGLKDFFQEPTIEVLASIINAGGYESFDI